MNINDLIKTPCEWLKSTGAASDIVMSSRIRLARNIKGYAFPHRLAPEQAEELVELVCAAVKKNKNFKKGLCACGKDLNDLDKQFLVERHLISREHACHEGPSAVCVEMTETMSVMVLEEDHLRIQVLEPGFNLEEAWKLMDSIDTALEEQLSYAFDPMLGYLCACPTNVGTGLRASCMMHLPALVMTKQMNKVIQAISKLSLTCRGMFGEGTEASGNLFQISNQATLGCSEQEVIDSLGRVIKQIIDNEKESRDVLLKKRKLKLEDQVWRAVGVLKTARVIPSREALAFLSMVRLGADLQLIQGLSRDKLNEIFLYIQPAHLQKNAGKELSSEQRDQERAAYLRQQLTGIQLA